MTELPPPLPPPLPQSDGGDVPVASVVPDSPAPLWPPFAARLAYSLPTTNVRPQRPRLVTAVGVLSLMVAVLGVFGGIGTAVAALVFYGHARQMGRDAQAAMLSRPVQLPTPTRRVRTPPEVGPNGFREPQRSAFVQALYSIHPLRPPRVDQLDAVLARHGQTILAGGSEDPAGAVAAPDRVRALVIDHGQLFSGGRTLPPDYFRLAAGRLELYDDRSVFYPADGSPTIRNSLVRPVVRRALTEAEVDAVVKQARQLGGDKLNAAQVSSLTTVLSAPDQKLVGPPGDAAPTEPISVTPAAEGAVGIRFSQGQLDLGAQGQVLAASPGPAPPPSPRVAAFVVVLVASLGGAALAVLLAVAAVLTLRGLPSGRRLHFAWAWVKIPLTAVTAVAFWWMASVFYEETAAFRRTAPMVFFSPRQTRWVVQPWHPLLAGLVALIYPVVLLLVLRSRSVREYFHPTE